jgi:hypothetical protein
LAAADFPSHHIPRPKHKVTNWTEYDAALRQRGSPTVWVSEEAIAGWGELLPLPTPCDKPLRQSILT